METIKIDDNKLFNNLKSTWDSVDWNPDTAYYTISDSTFNVTNAWDTKADKADLDRVERKVDKLAKEPEVPIDVKTKLKSINGNLYVAHYKDGFKTGDNLIMSDIKDVVVNNNTVIVKFADGSKTKAVLESGDWFSLEQGISICVTKKLLGEDGSNVYNKLINRAYKVKARNEKAEQAKQAAIAAEKAKKQAEEEKYRKYKAKKREAEIAMQAEAYERALKRFYNK